MAKIEFSSCLDELITFEYSFNLNVLYLNVEFDLCIKKMCILINFFKNNI